MNSYIFVAACVILTGVGQVLLKIGAGQKKGPYSIYFNPYTISGYVLFIVVSISTVLALQGLELKIFYALMSLNYVIVILLSKLILKESITVNKIMATFLIVIGVIIFNI